MTDQDSQKIKDLVASGVIGAALGALITDSKGGALLGALAGVALMASIKAQEDALKTNLPLLIEEEGSLFELQNGNKKFIKKLPPKSSLPKTKKLR